MSFKNLYETVAKCTKSLWFWALAKKCPGARPFVAKFKLQKNNNYLDIIHEIALQIVHEFLTGESI